MIFSDTKTEDLFIPSVIERTRCSVHNKDVSQPCWWVPLLENGYSPAVCNARALNAGFVGDIDPRSLQIGRRNSR